MTRTDDRGKRSQLAEVSPHGLPPADTADNDVTVKVYSVKRTAKILGIGLTATYAGISRGDIPAVRIGGRWLVSHVALARKLGATPS